MLISCSILIRKWMSEPQPKAQAPCLLETVWCRAPILEECKVAAVAALFQADEMLAAGRHVRRQRTIQRPADSQRIGERRAALAPVVACAGRVRLRADWPNWYDWPMDSLCFLRVCGAPRLSVLRVRGERALGLFSCESAAPQATGRARTDRALNAATSGALASRSAEKSARTLAYNITSTGAT